MRQIFLKNKKGNGKEENTHEKKKGGDCRNLKTLNFQVGVAVSLLDPW